MSQRRSPLTRRTSSSMNIPPVDTSSTSPSGVGDRTCAAIDPADLAGLDATQDLTATLTSRTWKPMLPSELTDTASPANLSQAIPEKEVEGALALSTPLPLSPAAPQPRTFTLAELQRHFLHLQAMIQQADALLVDRDFLVNHANAVAMLKATRDQWHQELHKVGLQVSWEQHQLETLSYFQEQGLLPRSAP
ncbi:hypothetical protein DFQ26_000791 [Actinomortierella ambigua]|nr:hypothetical protein DFQ26_000791 [Actinomortierella ambigua]